MSKKGYAFESETEDFFLKQTDMNKQTPLLKFNDKGLLLINRSFRVPNSGAITSIKGDVITAIPWLPKQFKVECKARYMHNKKDGQIVLFEKEWITKNEEEAKRDNQISVLTFSFKKVKQRRQWWIIHNLDFEFLRFHAMFNFHKISIDVNLKQSSKTIKFVHKDLAKISDNCVYHFKNTNNNEFYYLIPHAMLNTLMEKLKCQT